MRLDVFLTPGEVVPADIADRAVVVIDVLRASTTVVQALAAGARSVYPVGSIEDALRLANTLGRDEVLLSGERKCLPIEGFDLGNSPAEFTPERVAGKTLVMSTTNGTLAMTATPGAARVLIGAFTNLSAVVAELVRGLHEPVMLCAGREKHFGLEDAVLAGRVAQGVRAALPELHWELNDGAEAAVALAERFTDLEALFRMTAAGQGVIAAGLEADLDVCARVDAHAVVPVLQDRQITLPPRPAEPAAETEPAAGA